jgi:beta-N-acetylhexosaminidase
MDSDWPPSDEDPFDFDTSERPRPRIPKEPAEPPPDPTLPPEDPGPPPPAEPPSGTGEPPSSEGLDIPPPRYRPGEPYEDPFIDTSEARRRASERGDPFDTGEYRAHRAAGRPRHRDLPAAVRRRQIFGVVGLVALFLIGIWFVFLRGGGGGGGDEGPPLKRMAGQTIIGTLGEDGVDAKLLQRVQKGQLGGVIIVSDNEGEVQSDIAKLQKAARQGDNPPVLVMADQEGGFVKRLPGPPDLGPDEIADEGPETAQTEGQKTGEYLAGLGVNVDLAPVLDVGHDNTEESIVSRVYSEDPAEVGELGSAFITGLQGARVAATAKHFPGLGLATTNTDFDVVEIRGREEELAADIEPFTQAIAAGVDMIMVSTAVYPDLYGSKPAAFAPAAIQTQLRGQLGFKGVVITDDLEAPGANTPPGNGAVQTIAAGGDLALLARTEGSSVSAFNAVVKAVKDGRLDEATLEAAYERILALKKKIG